MTQKEKKAAEYMIQRSIEEVYERMIQSDGSR